MKNACRAGFFLSVSLLCSTATPAQTQRALLIGINTYQPPGTTASHPPGCVYGRCELGYFENLDGAVNDAQSMADLLTSPRFGFPANQVVLLTNPVPPRPGAGELILPADQTTREGILAAMQKYLVDVPQRGDTVVFYVASHGSLRINTKGTKLTVEVNGRYLPADSTLVASDAYKGGYDVRDREMTRIFNAALDKGIHLTVIFDNCHSGGISRGINAKYRERVLPFDPRDVAEAPPVQANGEPVPGPTLRTDNPALVFSAVQQDQSARELPDTDPPTEPHGAFTAALLEALEVLPADTPAQVVYQRVRAVLQSEDVTEEDPDLDANAERREQPLFGGTAGAASGTIRSAALGTSPSGSVWLDVGRVAGVGVGSEFTSSGPNSNGEKIQLRVIALDGIARSVASVISPTNAKVKPGDIFELTKWDPAPSAPLRVFHWPATLSQADLLAAAAQLRAAGIGTVSDPAEEPWTHMLSWDGSKWTLQQAGAPSPIPLGVTLTSAVLRQKVPSGAKLWVNFPPSRELAVQLLPADSNSTVQTAGDLASAEYALTGVLTANGPAWAWFHKNELAAGPPDPNATPHDPGCSPTSQYPVRSSWIVISNADSIAQGATALNRSASLLARVHGWFELADSPAGGSTRAYYSLALIPAGGGAPITPATVLHAGDRLTMSLETNNEVRERRWVYILDIDCHGQGTVLYPRDYSENQFPNDSDTGNQFPLRGASTLRIGPPFGIDTFILLSTAQPLSDPYLLNFEGVTRGAGPQSPLEQLLSDASQGTRGNPAQVPVTWGIGMTTIRSVRQASQ